MQNKTHIISASRNEFRIIEDFNKDECIQAVIKDGGVNRTTVNFN
ncbi:MAG: hypothetical protein WDA24_08380 [Tissierellales bacterium]